ncbi:PAS domain-containing sensor histidine kinase [Pseudonocardia spinosispora]|uniref:hybrid sensor histidine kinase/response regulator n=1 Tax=Pseudonocardia spinosispora TaxID=103441 RepID=UPI000401A798|nr:PAS domain-containing sensor histidine kinase [Pseudonocardia spinosispora]
MARPPGAFDIAALSSRFSPLPSAFLGPHGIQVASGSFAEMLGVPLNNVLRRQLSELPLELADDGDLDAVTRGGGRHRVLLPDGRSMMLHAAVVPTAKSHVVVQFEDLSGWEEEFRGTANRLLELVDNFPALMFIKGLDGEMLMVNKGWMTVFGLPPEQVIGTDDLVHFPPAAANAYRANDLEVLRTGRALEVEEPFVAARPDADVTDGAWLSLKFPLLDDGGRPYAVGAICTDISRRKREEREARQARDEAERANRAKGEFLSRMSHELRTPLNAILGFGALLRLEELGSEERGHVQRVLDAGQHLLRLVNDVLDESWSDGTAPAPTLATVSAASALSEAIELIEPIARQRGVELTADLPESRHHLLADPRRLTQVLLNLLSNAIKYNRAGGTVRARCEVGRAHLRFLISDTGQGISGRDVGRLFTPFVRLEPQNAVREGSGLGLAVTRQLVEQMGGTVGVQSSTPGVGSTFFVDLPSSTSPVAVPRAPDPVPQRATGSFGTDSGQSATVLYIEDTQANIELVEKIIERMGSLTVLTATKGSSGVRLARQNRPELILLDLHLPDMDGAEVLDLLRADPVTSGIPVIVVSADASPGRIEQLRRAGVADYLTKPLDLLAFALAVRTALRPEEERS